MLLRAGHALNAVLYVAGVEQGLSVMANSISPQKLVAIYQDT
jgi:hypothetical protein